MPAHFNAAPLAILGVLALLTACSSAAPKRAKLGEGQRIMAPGGPAAEPAALFVAGLDTNLDTLVTNSEFTAAQNRLWESADTNKDAALSVSELNDWRRHWFGSSEGWPGQFYYDADGNGTIDRREFNNGLQGIYTGFDANKDGSIARSELIEAPVEHGSSGRLQPDPTVGQTRQAPGP